MGYLVNQIGPYTFDRLRGTFQPEQEEVELFQRPGVNGTGVRRLGRKGKPFTVVTERFESDRYIAVEVTSAYLTLVGQDPVGVIERGTNVGTYQVLGVERIAIQPVASVVGPSIITNPSVNLVVRWKLIATG